ncbi:MAG: Na+/H+ antiporter subunit E [Bacteroidales bacterium]|jgi:multicomponent Na+:H+ antiporter subunit E|nr:Na+/H+ antiporter subunit E [Bacteroidales bacterium]
MSQSKPSIFKRLPGKLWAFLKFIPFYALEMILSSSILANDILRPKKDFKHGIVAYKLDLKSETAILAFVNLISMTPGSLSVDLSPDRKILYIHSMYLEDPEKFMRDVKLNFEKRIREVFE